MLSLGALLSAMFLAAFLHLSLQCAVPESKLHIDKSSLLSCCLSLPGCLAVILQAWGWRVDMDALARDAPVLRPPGRQHARALHHLLACLLLAWPLPVWAAKCGQQLAFWQMHGCLLGWMERAVLWVTRSCSQLSCVVPAPFIPLNPLQKQKNPQPKSKKIK